MVAAGAQGERAPGIDCLWAKMEDSLVQAAQISDRMRQAEETQERQWLLLKSEMRGFSIRRDHAGSNAGLVLAKN